ncbi:MAG TPA: hypothetical protein VGL56_05705 [Fimbriimonadaceae bacterium]
MPFVRLPAQYMGSGPYMFDIGLEIYALFKRHLFKSYSSELDSLDTVLRVDAENPSLAQWHESGLKRLRLSRKYRYVTVDVCFQNFEYVGVSREDMRKLMLERIWEGIELCVARIKKDKVDFKDEEFRVDLLAARFEIEAKWCLGQPGSP